MRKLYPLLLLPLLIAAAQITEGPWTLYRGTSIVQPRVDYPSLQACAAAADALGVARTYTCRTSATVVVTAAPQPVNCAVSAWSSWQAGAWSACSSGTQSRTETRTRTITTQPANGGAACPALTETRTVSQACSTEPPPAGVTGSYEPGPLAVTLTGTYARWPGYSAATAGPIGNVSGGNAYSDDQRTVNGTRDGLWKGAGEGFTFTVAGSSTPRTLKVYVGGWNSGARFTAGAYSHTIPNTAEGWSAVYTVTFTGTLQVSWAMTAGDGNVNIQAAALGQPAPPPPGTGTATLSWQAPGQYTNGSALPAAEIAGFRIYRGSSASALQRQAEVGGSARSFIAEQLASGTHYFAVTTVSTAGAESAPTEVRSKTIP